MSDKKEFVFDKAACIKKLDEVGKSVITYKGRKGYDVDAYLKSAIVPLDARLNVAKEQTKELQYAILALPLTCPPVAPATPKAPEVQTAPSAKPTSTKK